MSYSDNESDYYDEDVVLDQIPKFLTQSSKSVWVSKDGRETKVEDLDNFHIANIMNMLRRVAYDRITRVSLDHETPSAHNIHDYLMEHCITYPALVTSLKDRKIWNIHKIDLGTEHKLHDLEYSADSREKKLLSIIQDLNDRVKKLEKRK